MRDASLAGRGKMAGVTEYHVFLCIFGLGAVVALGLSVRNALRTRTTYVGDDLISRSFPRSQHPVLFWMHIAAQVIGGLVLLAAVLLSVFWRG